MSDRTSPETETLIREWRAWAKRHETAIETADEIAMGDDELCIHMEASRIYETCANEMEAALAKPRLAPTPDLRLRELLEFWSDRTRLQTFEDRERFRKAAGEALASPDTSTLRTERFLCLCCEEYEVKKDGDECEFCRLTYRTDSSPLRASKGE